MNEVLVIITGPTTREKVEGLSAACESIEGTLVWVASWAGEPSLRSPRSRMTAEMEGGLDIYRRPASLQEVHHEMLSIWHDHEMAHADFDSVFGGRGYDLPDADTRPLLDRLDSPVPAKTDHRARRDHFRQLRGGSKSHQTTRRHR